MVDYDMCKKECNNFYYDKDKKECIFKKLCKAAKLHIERVSKNDNKLTISEND